MKRIISILLVTLYACGEPRQKPIYVQEKIVWTVNKVVVAKYSYVSFVGRWRNIPVYNRSYSNDGYYYKRFTLKAGDTVHQNVSVLLSRESDKTIIEVIPDVRVKKYQIN